MAINQAQYTRLGGRGSGSGWDIAAKSPNASKIAIEEFKKICSGKSGQNIESELPMTDIVNISGIEYTIVHSDMYTYIININYKPKVYDGRGNTFYHSYFMLRDDFFELCKDSKKIVGLYNPASFELDYDYEKNIRILDDLDDIECNEKVVFKEIYDKYINDNDCYCKIIESVINSILDNKSFGIVIGDTDEDSYRNKVKELLYVICSALPYNLRALLTVSSSEKGKTHLYFTNRDDINCGYDINSKTIIGYSSSSKFIGEMALHSVKNIKESGSVFSELNNEIKGFWNRDREKIGRKELKVAWDCYKFNINYKGFDCIDALDSALDIDAVNTINLDRYIADLIGTIFEKNIKLDTSLINRLAKRFKTTKSSELKNKYGVFFAYYMCNKNNEKSFENLNELRNNSKNAYDIVLDRLNINNSEYLKAYFKYRIAKITEDGIANIDEDISKLNNPLKAEIIDDFSDKVIELFNNSLEKCMREKADNSKLTEEFENYRECCVKCDKVIDELFDRYLSVIDFSKYYLIDINIIEDSLKCGNFNNNKLSQLLFDLCYEENCPDIFFNNKYADINVNKLQDAYEGYLTKHGVNSDFEQLLYANYEKGIINTDQFIKVASNNKSIRKKDVIKNMVNNSMLLNNEKKCCEKFANELAKKFPDKKQNDLASFIWDALSEKANKEKASVSKENFESIENENIENENIIAKGVKMRFIYATLLLYSALFSIGSITIFKFETNSTVKYVFAGFALMLLLAPVVYSVAVQKIRNIILDCAFENWTGLIIEFVILFLAVIIVAIAKDELLIIGITVTLVFAIVLNFLINNSCLFIKSKNKE